ncbi:hypothetical protein ABGT16_04755 [Pseudomonas asiatica]|uniref:hypothetical protein n=1 Tax=Pseudomonas asiatica TaxID=2219225 RepID=UPI00345D8673
MLTSYQHAKSDELCRLGWTEDGRQNLPGPGRAPMRYIVVFSNQSGMRAFVYPASTEVHVVEEKPASRLALAFSEMQ